MVTSDILDINQFVKSNKWLWLLIIFFAMVSKSYAEILSKKQKEIIDEIQGRAISKPFVELIKVRELSCPFVKQNTLKQKEIIIKNPFLNKSTQKELAVVNVSELPKEKSGALSVIEKKRPFINNHFLNKSIQKELAVVNVSELPKEKSGASPIIEEKTPTVNKTKAGTIYDPFFRQVIVEEFPLLPSEIKTLKHKYIRAKQNGVEQINLKVLRINDELNLTVPNVKNGGAQDGIPLIDEESVKLQSDKMINEALVNNAVKQKRLIKQFNLIKVSMASNALPAVIKVNQEHTTTVSFVDVNGNPWPIKQFTFGRPDDFAVSMFNIQEQKEVNNSDEIKPVVNTNILQIKAKKKLALANLVVTMVSEQLDTITLIFTLDTFNGSKDAFMTAQIQGDFIAPGEKQLNKSLDSIIPGMFK